MQEAPLVDLLQLDDDIAISTTTRRSHNVLVEGERDEDHDGDEIDSSAYSAHALWNVGTVQLAHVATTEAGAHKGRPQPAYHGIADREGEQGERERSDEGFAIAVECVCEDGEGCAGEGEEGQGLGSRERSRRGGGHDGSDGRLERYDGMVGV